MRLWFVLAGVLAMGPFASMAQALEDPSAPAAYCAEVVNDDQTRNIPPSLIARVRQVLPFTQAANDDFVSQMTVWRCMSGRVFVCMYGANLPLLEGNYLPHVQARKRVLRREPELGFYPSVCDRTRHDLRMEVPRTARGCRGTAVLHRQSWVYK